MSYEIKDTFYARVIRKNNVGIYVRPEGSNEEAFAYGFCELPGGTRVLCSMRRPAKDRKSMLVSVDSTADCYYIA